MRVYIMTTEKHGLLGVYESHTKAENSVNEYMIKMNDEVIRDKRDFRHGVYYYYGDKDTAKIDAQDVY